MPTSIKTAQQYQHQRQAAIKSMEKVLALPSGSPERWRAAFKHFLAQRPEAIDEANFVAKEVYERRKLVDKFASTKHGRYLMSTPSFLLDVIRSTDPEYFIGKSAKELTRPSHLRLMKKAFPEFFVPEVI